MEDGRLPSAVSLTFQAVTRWQKVNKSLWQLFIGRWKSDDYSSRVYVVIGLDETSVFRLMWIINPSSDHYFTNQAFWLCSVLKYKVVTY